MISPSPLVACLPVQTICHVTLRPVVFRLVTLQSPSGSGTTFFWSSTSSLVSQWLIVTGGGWNGSPGISIVVEISHRPSFIPEAPWAEVAANDRIIKAAKSFIFISSPPLIIADSYQVTLPHEPSTRHFTCLANRLFTVAIEAASG